jgi:hypothetical protein
MLSEPLKNQIGDLLARDGGGPQDFELVPCGAGGNNRVFLVAAGARKVIAKWYFSHASDKRDRLGTEFGFLTYANRGYYLRAYADFMRSGAAPGFIRAHRR